jgi:DNA invertase Pin-like site-specific DNA recombinase
VAAPKRPVTPELFAALVADLRAELDAATPEQRAAMLARPRRLKPASFTGRGWVRQRVNLKEAAVLSGRKWTSLRVYVHEAPADRKNGRPEHRIFPPESGLGGWVIGQVALWCATRDERKAAGRRRRWPSHERYHAAARAFVEASGGTVTQRALALELGISTGDRRLARAILKEIGAAPPRRPTVGEVMPFMLEYVATQPDRRATRDDIMAALDAAGLHVWPHRAAQLYLKAGGRVIDRSPSDDDTPAALESTRWDGMVTAAQIARAYGVSGGTVKRALDAGQIWPVDRKARRLVFDPEKLTHRRDMRAGPVMKGHPLAAE